MSELLLKQLLSGEVSARSLVRWLQRDATQEWEAPCSRADFVLHFTSCLRSHTEPYCLLRYSIQSGESSTPIKLLQEKPSVQDVIPLPTKQDAAPPQLVRTSPRKSRRVTPQEHHSNTGTPRADPAVKRINTELFPENQNKSSAVNPNFSIGEIDHIERSISRNDSGSSTDISNPSIAGSISSPQVNYSTPRGRATFFERECILSPVEAANNTTSNSFSSRLSTPNNTSQRQNFQIPIRSNQSISAQQLHHSQQNASQRSQQVPGSHNVHHHPRVYNHTQTPQSTPQGQQSFRGKGDHSRSYYTSSDGSFHDSSLNRSHYVSREGFRTSSPQSGRQPQSGFNPLQPVSERPSSTKTNVCIGDFIVPKNNHNDKAGGKKKKHSKYISLSMEDKLVPKHNTSEAYGQRLNKDDLNTINIEDKNSFPDIGTNKPNNKQGTRRRINPTRLNTTTPELGVISGVTSRETPIKFGVKYDKAEHQHEAFKTPVFQPKEQADGFNAERNLLKMEKEKLLKKFNDLNNTDSNPSTKAVVQILTRHTPSKDIKGSVNKAQFVNPDPALVANADILDILAMVYSTLIDLNLVVNVTSEVSFLFSLIASQQTVSDVDKSEPLAVEKKSTVPVNQTIMLGSDQGTGSENINSIMTVDDMSELDKSEGLIKDRGTVKKLPLDVMQITDNIQFVNEISSDSKKNIIKTRNSSAHCCESKNLEETLGNERRNIEISNAGIVAVAEPRTGDSEQFTKETVVKASGGKCIEGSVTNSVDNSNTISTDTRIMDSLDCKIALKEADMDIAGKTETLLDESEVKDDKNTARVETRPTSSTTVVDTKESKTFDMSVLMSSVHNCVYFALKTLEHQAPTLDIILDASTLRSLQQNARVKIFAPQLADHFGDSCQRRQKDEQLEPLAPASQIDNKNVCFITETDSVENFQSEKCFYSFKKQRDLFYQIFRSWEINHSKPGWSFASKLTASIRSLLSLGASPQLARLFRDQLLLACTDSGTGDLAPALLAGPTNQRRLNQLARRLTAATQPALSDPIAPRFSPHEEFFREFLVIADSSGFRQHLLDSLVQEIMRLDQGLLLTSSSESRSQYVQSVVPLQLLGKFLGLVLALPYLDSQTSSVDIRGHTQPPLDLLGILERSRSSRRLLLTVPWLVQLLALLDHCSLRLPYYKCLLCSLFRVYTVTTLTPDRASSITAMTKSTGVFLRVCLGWLFDMPHFPQEFFYQWLQETRMNPNIITKHIVNSSKTTDETVSEMKSLNIPSSDSYNREIDGNKTATNKRHAGTLVTESTRDIKVMSQITEINVEGVSRLDFRDETEVASIGCVDLTKTNMDKRVTGISRMESQDENEDLKGGCADSARYTIGDVDEGKEEGAWLDCRELVSSAVLTAMWPQLRQLRGPVVRGAEGADSSSRRHITPVTMRLADCAHAKERLVQMQLEEWFLRSGSQWAGSSRALRLVGERVGATIVHLARAQLPALKALAARSVRAMLIRRPATSESEVTKLYEELVCVFRTRCMQAGRCVAEERSARALGGLLPSGTEPRCLHLLAQISARTALTALADWIHAHTNKDVFGARVKEDMKRISNSLRGFPKQQLSAQAERSGHALSRYLREAPAAAEPTSSAAAEKEDPDRTVHSSSACIIQLKDLCLQLVTGATWQLEAQRVRTLVVASLEYAALCGRCNYVQIYSKRTIGQLCVDLAVLLVALHPDIVKPELLGMLMLVWSNCLRDEQAAEDVIRLPLLPPESVRDDEQSMFQAIVLGDNPVPDLDDSFTMALEEVSDKSADKKRDSSEGVIDKKEDSSKGFDKEEDWNESVIDNKADPDVLLDNKEEIDRKKRRNEFFDSLLCSRNVMFLGEMGTGGPEVWGALAQLLVFSLKMELLTEDSLTEQCLAVYRQDWPQVTLEGLSDCMHRVSRSLALNSQKLQLLLDFLAEFCRNISFAS